MHYVETGSFHDGRIHDFELPLLKWGDPDGPRRIRQILLKRDYVHFTIVRNPFRRIVSAFADKIFGYQRNGKRYRGGLLHRAMASYDVDFGPRSNLIANFRGFVRFVADSLTQGNDLPSDLHWTPCSTQIAFNLRRNPTWRPHTIGHVERLHESLTAVAERAGLGGQYVPTTLPRENTTSLGPVTWDVLYGERELELVRKAYREDFKLFRYSEDPAIAKPLQEVDVDEVVGRLRGNK
jgi:hypothetical protein